MMKSTVPLDSIKINTQMPQSMNTKPTQPTPDHMLSPITPMTPNSPFSHQKTKPNNTSMPDVLQLNLKIPTKSVKYSVERTFKQKGFNPIMKYKKTLQGSVWKITTKHKKNGKITSIAKVTKKILHDKKITVVNGIKLPILENIINEAAILKYLTYNSPPSTLAKWEGFFADQFNLFLIMEDGGNDLFRFVVKSHDEIARGRLLLSDWHKWCKIAMNQMVDVLDWMHNTMQCCHLDLSLENFVIDGVAVKLKSNGQIMYGGDFTIKLIDFGVAEVFTSKNENNEINFRSTKWVGKQIYKSPEIYKKQIFDARCADCWSLGVIFFILFVGNPPFENPSMNDAAFEYIMNGKLVQLLKGWKKLGYVSKSKLDLLINLFTSEQNRLSINEIKNHPCLL